MEVEILLKSDLEIFKDKLITELKQLFKPETCKKEKMDWITDAEAQKLLSISRTKLYQLRKDGELHYSTIGGRVYYRLDDIHHLLNKNATKYD